jgi:hypothetical protein
MAPRRALVDLELTPRVDLHRIALERPTSETAVTVGMRTRGEIVECTLRGKQALDVGMHSQLIVRDTHLEGSETTVHAGMHARVRLERVQLSGKIERDTGAIVEVANQ